MSFEMPGLARQLKQDMQADLFWNAKVDTLIINFMDFLKNEEGVLNDNNDQEL